jgi:arylsulfatase A-like enzyme
LPTNIPKQARDIDQPQAALLADLQARGMLDDTLVVWGGEFGRTVYGQGGLQDDYGRDHHGRCYSVWMAGGGIRPGVVHGETDDYGYNIVRDPVHVHDLNATLLQCLGYDHKRLTYRFQGRDYRLTDVEGNVVKEILA